MREGAQVATDVAAMSRVDAIVAVLRQAGAPMSPTEIGRAQAVAEAMEHIPGCGEARGSPAAAQGRRGRRGAGSDRRCAVPTEVGRALVAQGRPEGTRQTITAPLTVCASTTPWCATAGGGTW